MYIVLLSATLVIIFTDSAFGSQFFYKEFRLQNMFNRKYQKQYREYESLLRPAGHQNPIRLVVSQDQSMNSN